MGALVGVVACASLFEKPITPGPPYPSSTSYSGSPYDFII